MINKFKSLFNIQESIKEKPIDEINAITYSVRYHDEPDKFYHNVKDPKRLIKEEYYHNEPGSYTGTRIGYSTKINPKTREQLMLYINIVNCASDKLIVKFLPELIDETEEQPVIAMKNIGRDYYTYFSCDNGSFEYNDKPDENGDYFLEWEITDKGIYKSYLRIRHPDTGEYLLDQITSSKGNTLYSREINPITRKQMEVQTTEQKSYGTILTITRYYIKDDNGKIITYPNGDQLVKNMEFRPHLSGAEKYELFPEIIDGEQPIKRILLTNPEKFYSSYGITLLETIEKDGEYQVKLNTNENIFEQDES